jgi:uncharacterized protein YecE (DUF72 family)
MKSQIPNHKSQIAVGCQGWNYADWTTKAAGETVFYPSGTKSNEMLAVYARAFETVEVDSTFYAVPKEETIDNWRKLTPDNFTFSLKMPREITHEGELQKASFSVLDEFCTRVLRLKEKLAAVLIQLPPQFGADEENVRTFLEFLPRLPTDVRFAVEFRARNWLRGETLEILKKHRVALCLTDGAWIPRAFMFEAAKVQTADFFYVRFMGERDLTAFDRVQRAQDANLWLWHEVLSDLKAPTFVYFSNFYEGFAPVSANKLKRMFRQETTEFSELNDQPSLF